MICNNEDRVQKSIKQTDDMFEALDKTFCSDEELGNAYLAAISVHLRDISLSLAVLADHALNKENKDA